MLKKQLQVRKEFLEFVATRKWDDEAFEYFLEYVQEWAKDWQEEFESEE